MTLSEPERCFHLQWFRSARTALLDDSEAFLEVFVCIEALGMQLPEDRVAAVDARTPVTQVRSSLCTSPTPVLVVDKPHPERLLGNVTAFD